MHRRHDLIGVPGVAGLAAEVHATLERVFAADPTDVVSVVPERSAAADSAAIAKGHATLLEQRSFDGPWDGAASKLFGSGMGSRIVRLIRPLWSGPGRNGSRPNTLKDTKSAVAVAGRTGF